MAAKLSSDEEQRDLKEIGLSDPEEREEDIIQENLKFVDKFLHTIRNRGTNISPGAQEKLKEFKREWSGFFSDESSDSKGIEKLKTENQKESNALGCRAKTTKKNKPCVSTSSSTNDETSTDPNSTEDEDKSSLYTKKKGSKGASAKKKRKPETFKRTGDTEDDDMKKFMSVMAKLDSRKVPSQEIFDESSGQTLKRYLAKFENYCENNFKGDKDFWIGELERHLAGKTLEAFKAVRDIDDSYENLKEKLLEWYANLAELRKKKNRLKFKNASYVNSEMLYLYSSRLEKMHRVAYPKHNQEFSQVLRDKYISTIPKGARKVLQSMVISHKLKDQKLSWKTIQKWARLQDLEKEKDDGQYEKQEIREELVINLGKENTVQKECKKYKDVSTQDDLQQFERYNGRVLYAEQPPQRLYLQNPQPTPEYQRRYQTQTFRNPAYNNNYTDRNIAYNNNMQHQHNTFSRPPRSLLGRNIQCNYCNRLGHTAHECRTKLNRCYLCGSRDHHFKQCSNKQYQPDQYQEQRTELSETEHKHRERSANMYRPENTYGGENRQRSFSQPRADNRQYNRNDDRQRRYSGGQAHNQSKLN